MRVYMSMRVNWERRLDYSPPLCDVQVLISLSIFCIRIYMRILYHYLYFVYVYICVYYITIHILYTYIYAYTSIYVHVYMYLCQIGAATGQFASAR